jgi:hypothetical protein
MAAAGLRISQKDNFNANFGDVLRSSGIFYFAKAESLRTTISLMNYWQFKRAIGVAVVATVRSKQGRLISRCRLEFSRGHVVNFSPDVPVGFEGSVEIEAFSTTNLAIPYAAIMGIYEAAESVSMVHSYSRTYSQHEIDEGRTITVGHEGCWRIADDDQLVSFCVFHNGPTAQPAQIASLEVICGNESRVASVALDSLAPFETVMLRPRDHIPDLISWLNGREGYASLDFNLGNAFTRMLLGHQRIDGSELSVTHSNFDYRRHSTDLADGCEEAFMHLAPQLLASSRIVVYPHSHKGAYEMMDGRRQAFGSGSALVSAPSSTLVRFRALDGTFPSRLVTGLETVTPGRLRAECSLGVYHANRPLKRSHWGVVAATDDLSSKIVAVPFTSIYGPPSGKVKAALYSAVTQEVLETEWSWNASNEVGHVVDLTDLFPRAREHLGGEFGFIYMTSEYGGLQCFTQIAKANGSTAFEHTF